MSGRMLSGYTDFSREALLRTASLPNDWVWLHMYKFDMQYDPIRIV